MGGILLILVIINAGLTGWLLATVKHLRKQVRAIVRQMRVSDLYESGDQRFIGGRDQDDGLVL